MLCTLYMPMCVYMYMYSVRAKAGYQLDLYYNKQPTGSCHLIIIQPTLYNLNITCHVTLLSHSQSPFWFILCIVL